MPYICDPAKNVTCTKTICAHNEQAFDRLCRLTAYKEYAITDENSKPVQYVEDDDE